MSALTERRRLGTIEVQGAPGAPMRAQVHVDGERVLLALIDARTELQADLQLSEPEAWSLAALLNVGCSAARRAQRERSGQLTATDKRTPIPADVFSVPLSPERLARAMFEDDAARLGCADPADMWRDLSESERASRVRQAMTILERVR